MMFFFECQYILILIILIFNYFFLKELFRCKINSVRFLILPQKRGFLKKNFQHSIKNDGIWQKRNEHAVPSVSLNIKENSSIRQ